MRTAQLLVFFSASVFFAPLSVLAQPEEKSEEESDDPPEGDEPASDEPGETGHKTPKDEASTGKVVPKDEAKPEGKADGAPSADPDNRAEKFVAFSDFVDTRVTFLVGNVNVLAGPGERTNPTSGYRIGVDPKFNLFLENVNTRFTGFESLSQMVLYKKLPAFFELFETEGALAALVLADTNTGQFRFFDSGTYLRLIRKLGEGEEADVGSIDLTAWPVSADRFRLGYTYLISWGGTAIFPGKLQSSSITEGAVPGLRLRLRGPKGKFSAFLGFKSALLLSREPGTEAGEQVPNYGLLAGGGVDLFDALVVEANGGFFQKGAQERPGLEGERILAYGASARLTVYQGARPRDSADFRLLKNDPKAPIDYYLFKPYKPGVGWSAAVEGSVLAQNLEDPDLFASEQIAPAVSAGFVGLLKVDELQLRLDAFFQSIDFILFNVPGFVPFQAVPDGATTTPEIFTSLTLEYYIDALKFLPSLSLGLKIPATYKGQVLSDQGVVLGGADPGEVRTQVIVNETTRIVLPPDTGAQAILGAVLKLPFALSEMTTISGEVRFELDDNQPRLAQDNERGEVTYFFDDPVRLSLALVLQSRW